jgi:hypothetical protein
VPDCAAEIHDDADDWWQIREEDDQVLFETSHDGSA